MVGEGGAKIKRYNNFTLPFATYNLIQCQRIICFAQFIDLSRNH